MIIFGTILGGALALAIAGSLTFWRVGHWYDFYIPIVLFIAGIVGMIIFWLLLMLILEIPVKKQIHDKPSKYSRFWLEQGHDFLMLAARIKVRISGKNKLPRGQRFILVANHRSNFDSMVMTSKLKKYDLAFLTKQSNYKIPFFGMFLYGCCYYPLDRSDQLQSLEIFKKAGELIARDAASVAVFPEGTRQREKVLGDFHEGVFNIALRAKCPIVVTTVDGGEQVHKRFPWQSTTIRVDILGVIPYDEIEGQTAKAISDRVHDIMYDHLEKIDILRNTRSKRQ